MRLLDIILRRRRRTASVGEETHGDAAAQTPAAWSVWQDEQRAQAEDVELEDVDAPDAPDVGDLGY